VFDRRRPDPALGVFETLLVLDGRPVELGAHLNRLGSSLETLFPDRTPPDLSQLDVPSESGRYGSFSDGTSPCRVGVLRITVTPDADGRLEIEVEAREPHGDFLSLSARKAPTGEVELMSVTFDGGLGAHKWVDRSMLDEALAKLPASTLPLVIDDDGSVLEASRANVFAVRDGILLTPPLDGRILPGVTRTRVMELAGELGTEAREAGLSLSDVIGADEVFLTGSVRGIEPVGAIDGTVLATGGNVTSKLSTELRRTWVRAKVG
jgi:para-aminobenzoate synthetase/4-amino-4-deoxychorismate lyase